jgi:hypothetical protein
MFRLPGKSLYKDLEEGFLLLPEALPVVLPRLEMEVYRRVRLQAVKDGVLQPGAPIAELTEMPAAPDDLGDEVLNAHLPAALIDLNRAEDKLLGVFQTTVEQEGLSIALQRITSQFGWSSSDARQIMALYLNRVGAIAAAADPEALIFAQFLQMDSLASRMSHGVNSDLRGALMARRELARLLLRRTGQSSVDDLVDALEEGQASLTEYEDTTPALPSLPRPRDDDPDEL